MREDLITSRNFKLIGRYFAILVKLEENKWIMSKRIKNLNFNIILKNYMNNIT